MENGTISKALVFCKWSFAIGLFCFCDLGRAGDWGRHEVSLKQTTIKINNLQDDIIGLSQKRTSESDPHKKEEILEDIKKKYTELKNAHKDLLKEMEHVRFEHPEKGDKSLKEYKHIKLKKLEEIESDTSAEGQMLRLKSKAEQKYGVPKSNSEESTFIKPKAEDRKH